MPPTIDRIAVLVCLLGLAGCASSGGAEHTTDRRPNERGEDPGETASTAPGDERTEEGLPKPEGFDVIAHRGARALKPENTLPSFEAALDARPDVIELDLHLSNDDRLVVWHDPFVRSSKCRAPKRQSAESTEGGAAEKQRALPDPTSKEKRRESAKLRNLTADQLRSYACDQNPQPEVFPRQNAEPTELAGDDYGIVTLEEFFDFVERYATSEEKTDAQRENAKQVEFFLEIKRHPDHPSFLDDGFDGSGPATMEKRLVEIVRDRGLVERSAVQGFIKSSLWAVGELEPDLRLSVAEAERGPALTKLVEHGASFWSPNWELVDDESIREAHEAGLRVVPWTLNEADEIRRLMELGIDGIITDDPTLFASDD